ncbi:MAG: hypothetical protein WDN28_27620 [Chthoniobacter sp.]
MKYLPSLLTISLLTTSLLAQNAVPPGKAGDPFVKNSGDKPAGEVHASPNIVVVLEAYAMSRDEAAALLDAESGSVARYACSMRMPLRRSSRICFPTWRNTCSAAWWRSPVRWSRAR